MERIIVQPSYDIDDETKSESTTGDIHSSLITSTGNIITYELDDKGDFVLENSLFMDGPIYAKTTTPLLCNAFTTREDSSVSSDDSKFFAFKLKIALGVELQPIIPSTGLAASYLNTVGIIYDETFTTNVVPMYFGFDDPIGDIAVCDRDIIVTNFAPNTSATEIEIYHGKYDPLTSLFVNPDWNNAGTADPLVAPQYLNIPLGVAHTLVRTRCSSDKFISILKNGTAYKILSADVAGYTNTIGDWNVFDFVFENGNIFFTVFMNGYYYYYAENSGTSYVYKTLDFSTSELIFTVNDTDGYTRSFTYNKKSDNLYIILRTTTNGENLHHCYNYSDSVGKFIENMTYVTTNSYSDGVPDGFLAHYTDDYVISSIYDASGNNPGVLYISKDSIDCGYLYIKNPLYISHFGAGFFGPYQSNDIYRLPHPSTWETIVSPVISETKYECKNVGYEWMPTFTTSQHLAIDETQSVCHNIETLGEIDCGKYFNTLADYSDGKIIGKYRTKWNSTLGVCEVISDSERASYFTSDGQSSCTAAGYTWDAKSGTCVDIYSGDN